MGHQVGYDKLMPNTREWKNCFIKYQTLTLLRLIVFKNVHLYKHRNCILLLIVTKAEFHGQFPYWGKLQDIVFML